MTVINSFNFLTIAEYKVISEDWFKGGVEYMTAEVIYEFSFIFI